MHDAATKVLISKRPASDQQSTTPRPVVNRTITNKEQALTEQQFELERIRNELAAGRIDTTLQDDTFARPDPGLDDHITPPDPHELERDDWWRDSGARWWERLDFEELAPNYQLRLLEQYPGLRNSPHIPGQVRDILNRRYLQLAIARLTSLATRSDNPVTTLTPDLEHQLETMQAALVDLYTAEWDTALAAGLHGVDIPPVRLIAFDHNPSERDSSTTITIGDSYHPQARNKWHIPRSSTIDSINETIARAAEEAIAQAADNAVVRTTYKKRRAHAFRRFDQGQIHIRINRVGPDIPGYIDNGIRRFRTSPGGDAFGRRYLPTCDQLAETTRRVILAQDKDPEIHKMLDDLLRGLASDDDLPARIEQLRTNSEFSKTLDELDNLELDDLDSIPTDSRTESDPNTAMQDLHRNLQAKTARTEDEERLLRALDAVRPNEAGYFDRRYKPPGTASHTFPWIRSSYGTSARNSPQTPSVNSATNSARQPPAHCDCPNQFSCSVPTELYSMMAMPNSMSFTNWTIARPSRSALTHT